MSYLYFYSGQRREEGKDGGEERKKSCELGESLNTANEALIHLESF